MKEICYHVLRGLGSAFMAGLTGAATMIELSRPDFILAFLLILVTTFLTLGVLVDLDAIKKLTEEKQ